MLLLLCNTTEAAKGLKGLAKTAHKNTLELGEVAPQLQVFGKIKSEIVHHVKFLKMIL